MNPASSTDEIQAEADRILISGLKALLAEHGEGSVLDASGVPARPYEH